MPYRNERTSVRLDAAEAAMLRQLAHAFGESKSDVVRRLIQEAYAKKLPKLSTRAGFGFAPDGLAAKPRRRKKA